MINTTIKSALAEMLVWPHRWIYPTKEGVDVKSLARSGGSTGLDAVCILRCSVIEASSLETFGNEDFLEKISLKKSVPDPYAVLEIRDQKHTTRHVKNDRNPKYAESFAFQLYDSKDELCVSFYDYDRISDDEPIGYTLISMSDYDMMSGEVVTAKWFDLTGGTRDQIDGGNKTTGRVCLKLQFLPLAQDSDSESEEDSNEEVVASSDDGVVKTSSDKNQTKKKLRMGKDGNTPTKLLNHHDAHHEVPHMGTLILTIKRARKVKKVGFFGTGLPDTHVKARIEKHRVKTKMIKNETDPVYDENFDFLINDASEAVLEFSIKDTEYGGMRSREMGTGKIALSKLIHSSKCSGNHEIELTDNKGKHVCVLEYYIGWRGLRSRASTARALKRRASKENL